MCWWCGDVSWTACSWWWVVPFLGIALCMTMCMLSASKRGHRRFACWRSDRLADLEEMKKECESACNNNPPIVKIGIQN